MADEAQYRYRAIDGAGRRVSGHLTAENEAAAFDHLRRAGLSPLDLKALNSGSTREPRVRALPDREAAEFLASLADLLRAGADIRTALGILGDRFERPAVRELCQLLSDTIGGGESLERAFAASFKGSSAFVAAMVAAGEAGGDLAGGLLRAAEIIQSRMKLRDQLTSVLAYPMFVLVSSVAAVFVILLFIVPAIAPLAEESGGEPALSLAILIGASNLLNDNLAVLGVALAISALLFLVANRLGALKGVGELLLLDGPARRTFRGITYGSFSISLGAMLAADAPMSEALRLANRTVTQPGARRKLEAVAEEVRQGQFLSDALGAVGGFPSAIVRLAAVGEATNTLGAMLARGGKLEEETALRRIEAFGRLAGPTMIVLLGGLLGALMGGLLSGVGQLGQSALN